MRHWRLKGQGYLCAHAGAKLGQEYLLRMVRWTRWHCPPDTEFEIRALVVWSRACYLSATIFISELECQYGVWNSDLRLSKRQQKHTMMTQSSDKVEPGPRTLGQSQRQRANIKPALAQSLIMSYHCSLGLLPSTRRGTEPMLVRCLPSFVTLAHHRAGIGWVKSIAYVLVGTQRAPADQCWLNVGSAPAMLVQQWSSIGSVKCWLYKHHLKIAWVETMP